MISLDIMHPLIKIQVALKGLTLVTGGQLLAVEPAADVFKEIEAGNFVFQIF